MRATTWVGTTFVMAMSLSLNQATALASLKLLVGELLEGVEKCFAFPRTPTNVPPKPKSPPTTTGHSDVSVILSRLPGQSSRSKS
jgi:hypothetical protein